MKRITVLHSISIVALISICSLGTIGCDRDALAEIAALTGGYFGDVVNTASTAAILNVWGLEGPEDADADADDHDHEHEEGEEEEAGHTHEAEPLHNYEH